MAFNSPWEEDGRDDPHTKRKCAACGDRLRKSDGSHKLCNACRHFNEKP